MVVQREELPYRYVIVEGIVIEAATFSPRDIREVIATRSLGLEAGQASADSMDGRESVLFTIRPDRWITQDYFDDF